jgi:hypothetical protein
MTAFDSISMRVSPKGCPHTDCFLFLGALHFYSKSSESIFFNRCGGYLDHPFDNELFKKRLPTFHLFPDLCYAVSTCSGNRAAA